MREYSIIVIATLLLQSCSIAVAQLSSQPSAPAWQAILKAQNETRDLSTSRQYSFACSCTKKNNKFFGRKSKQAIRTPGMIVTEGRPAKLEKTSQSPFVTGAQKVGQTKTGTNAYQPIITVLNEGYTVEVTIKALDEQHVQLDARFGWEYISSVETVTFGEHTTQSPTNNSITQRVVRAVRLGDTLKLEIPAFGNEKPMTFEYTIREVEGPELNHSSTNRSQTQVPSRS